MYGGGESTGFFSNGDIYSISRDDFKIYTNDFKEEGPVFRLSDNFPLDSTGKLIKSWSTGENAGLSGFYGTDMYLDGDGLHFIEWVKGPSNVNIHGIVDITTGEYTKIQ